MSAPETRNQDLFHAGTDVPAGIHFGRAHFLTNEGILDFAENRTWRPKEEGVITISGVTTDACACETAEPNHTAQYASTEDPDVLDFHVPFSLLTTGFAEPVNPKFIDVQTAVGKHVVELLSYARGVDDFWLRRYALSVRMARAMKIAATQTVTSSLREAANCPDLFFANGQR